jgi:hypothetical protein
MRKTVDTSPSDSKHRLMKSWFILPLCAALAACSARDEAPRPDAGSPTDAGFDATVDAALDAGAPPDADTDASVRECTPGTTLCRGGEVATCGPDARIASMTPCPAGQACADGRCVDACDLEALGTTYRGCTFRATSPAAIVTGHGGPRLPELGFGFHNPGSDSADITITGGALTTPVTATLAPDTSTFLTVPLIQGVFDRPAYGVSPTVLARDTASYRIRATRPVATYQFSPDYGLSLGDARFLMKSDATVLFPTHAWGSEYVAATMAPSCGTPPCGPEEMTFLQVTANTDGTMVEVTPTVAIEASVDDIVTSTTVTETPVAAIAADATARFTLDAGDVLQLASGFDLAGTKISASAPVQVISGNVGIRNPGEWAPLGDGHLHEAMLPARSWGTRYLVVPPPHPTRDEGISFTARFVATAMGAVLNFEPASVSPPITLAPNGTADLRGLTGSFRVVGDRPFLALGQSRASDVPTGDELNQPIGAASMVAYPPLDQWRTSYGFTVPADFTYAHVGVIFPVGATVEVDGTPVTGGTEVGTTGFVYRALPLDGASSTHRATGSVGFALLVYGQAAGSSYWYTAGLDTYLLY